MRQVYYQAAGGVVVHQGKVLLLDRPSRDEVRLPKGHIEEGESPAEAALREVREEAGYAQLEIVADLGTQQVQFVDPFRSRQVTRDERYFLMRLRGEQQVERDEKEQQFIPLWTLPADAVAHLTFETEREFLRRALRWMAEE
ncbi:MAG: NUDIX domain-containing protein [Anaerolineae bacterium]|jgi:8-oxo-dGTP pyrophosphatase MutT (NUDIX family)